jgi:hypothetical protein
MLSRTIVLRAMLVALAASALLGIASIFSPSALGKNLLLTAIDIAVASALLLPASPRDQGGRLDLGQRSCVGYIVISATLVGFACWRDSMPSNSVLSSLLLLWFLVGVPAIIVGAPALRSRRDADRSLALAESIMIWGAHAALLVPCALTLLGMGRNFNESLLTALAFVALGATVAAATSAIGRRSATTDGFATTPDATGFERRIAPIGIACAALAALAGAAALIEQYRNASAGLVSAPTPIMWTVMTALAAIAAPIGVWNGLGLARVQSPLRFLRHAAAISIGMIAALVAYGLATHAFADRANDDLLWKLIWTCIVLASTSLVGSAVLMRLNRGRAIAADRIEAIAWRCPRCETRATIGLGESCCATCGLAVRIDFRDDRCPGCAYDLRGQPEGAPNCPECGRVRQVMTRG